MAPSVSGVIENNRAILPGCRPESSPDLLKVQRKRLRRAQQDRSADGRHIHALGHEPGIAKHLDLACAEPSDETPPLIPVHFAVNVSSADPGRSEAGSDCLRVLERTAERDGRHALAYSHVVLHRVADEWCLTHDAIQVVSVEVAGSGMDSGEVDLFRRRITNRGYKEPGARQVGDRRAKNQLLKDVPEPAPVEALRGCCHPEHARIGVSSENFLPGTGNRVMGFIDDDQVEWNHAVEPAHQCLNRSDLHRVRSARHAGGNDAVLNTHAGESTRYLLDDLLFVRQEAHPQTAPSRSRTDVEK